MTYRWYVVDPPHSHLQPVVKGYLLENGGASVVVATCLDVETAQLIVDMFTAKTEDERRYCVRCPEPSVTGTNRCIEHQSDIAAPPPETKESK